MATATRQNRFIAAVGGSTRMVADCAINWYHLSDNPDLIRLTIIADESDLTPMSEAACEVFDRGENRLFVFTGTMCSCSGSIGGPMRATYTSYGLTIQTFAKDNIPTHLALSERLRLPAPYAQ